jgi:GalNAc-alpha-(1->4)-GalNAc-alpha-(1->3)-diNAcBac-PP-undecaprenol alpha-1,4-N-acetyl-D-galactosaminyltransferase
VPRKILLIIFNLAPGGAERVLVSLANGLARQGLDVTLVTVERESVGFYPLEPGVIRKSLSDFSRFQSSQPFGRILNAYRRLRALRHAIRAEAPDVVVSFVAPMNILVILATRWMGGRPKLVISERNDPKRQKLKPPMEWLRRVLYHRADTVTANTRGAIDFMSSYVPQEKLVHIPNPVIPPAAKAGGNPMRQQIILNIARLHFQKGHDILLDAFTGLSPALRGDWTLRIVGEGAELNRLRARAAALGLPATVFTGESVQNPWEEYEHAAIFVLPSRFEGLPNVLLEAMSMGCACVVSDASPGPLEFVRHEHSGLVVRAGDAAALSAALERLMNDSACRERLGRNARDEVRELSEGKVLERWISVLI